MSGYTRRLAISNADPPGVHAEFARIVKGVLGTDRAVWQFLRTGYDLKSVADHGTDPDAMITNDEAKTAIDDARRFLDQVSALLSPGPWIAVKAEWTRDARSEE